MIESLPEATRDEVVEHLCDYLEDLKEELQWDSRFRKTQPQVISAAQRARQEIAEGSAKRLYHDHAGPNGRRF